MGGAYVCNVKLIETELDFRYHPRLLPGCLLSFSVTFKTNFNRHFNRHRLSIQGGGFKGPLLHGLRGGTVRGISRGVKKYRLCDSAFAVNHDRQADPGVRAVHNSIMRELMIRRMQRPGRLRILAAVDGLTQLPAFNRPPEVSRYFRHIRLVKRKNPFQCRPAPSRRSQGSFPSAPT